MPNSSSLNPFFLEYQSLLVTIMTRLELYTLGLAVPTASTRTGIPFCFFNVNLS